MKRWALLGLVLLVAFVAPWFATDATAQVTRALATPRFAVASIRPAATARFPAAFSPPDIAGLVIWFDARTVTPLTDGDTLTGLTDLSGNGFDVTSDVGNRPTYRTAGGAGAINGHAVVDFNIPSDQDRRYPLFQMLAHDKTWRDLPADKQDHFAVMEMTSGILAAFAFSFPPTRTDGSIVPAWKRLAVVAGFVFALGVVKETADQVGYWAGQRDHGAEAGDLAADAAGVTVGVTIGAVFGAAPRILFQGRF